MAGNRSISNESSNITLGCDWETLDSHEVFIELQGVTDLPSDITASQCAFIKPDSERPLLKVRDFVYAGRYEDTVGTHLAFRISDTEKLSAGSAATANGDFNENPSVDRVDILGRHTTGNKKLQYIGKTNKLLRMTPASVRSKHIEKNHLDTEDSRRLNDEEVTLSAPS